MSRDHALGFGEMVIGCTAAVRWTSVSAVFAKCDGGVDAVLHVLHHAAVDEGAHAQNAVAHGDGVALAAFGRRC
jgi:hypothetical protein